MEDDGRTFMQLGEVAPTFVEREGGRERERGGGREEGRGEREGGRGGREKGRERE